MRPSLSAARKAILVGVMLLAPFVAVAQEYRGPKCLGPVCVERNESFEGLAKQLGGASRPELVYGYRTENHDAFLIIVDGGHGQVGSISLRDFAQYGTWTDKDEKLATQDIRNWRTSEGIGLGSTEADVAKAYGKPSGVADLELKDRDHHGGTRLLLYKGRLNGIVRATRFRLRDGKVSFVELENEGFLGPDCLGPACVHPSSPLRSLLAQLGSSQQKESSYGLYCYQTQVARAFLFLVEGHGEPQVEAAAISDFPNCARKRQITTGSDLRGWKTPEGIGLGSSEEEVLKAYGTPSRSEAVCVSLGDCAELIRDYRRGDKAPDIGEKILSYAGKELQRARFGIRNGKVSYILVSDEE